MIDELWGVIAASPLMLNESRGAAGVLEGPVTADTGAGVVNVKVSILVVDGPAVESCTAITLFLSFPLTCIARAAASAACTCRCVTAESCRMSSMLGKGSFSVPSSCQARQMSVTLSFPLPSRALVFHPGSFTTSERRRSVVHYSQRSSPSSPVPLLCASSQVPVFG